MPKNKREVLGIVEINKEEIIREYMAMIEEGTQYSGGLLRGEKPEVKYEVTMSSDLIGLEGEVFETLSSREDKLLTLRETAELLADNVGNVDKIKINSVYR